MTSCTRKRVNEQKIVHKCIIICNAVKNEYYKLQKLSLELLKK